MPDSLTGPFLFPQVDIRAKHSKNALRHPLKTKTFGSNQ
jgi:hypothetical protein